MVFFIGHFVYLIPILVLVLFFSKHIKQQKQADDAGLADTKDKEKAERTPVRPQHVLKWFGEVATHVKTQVDKVGVSGRLAPCGLVSSAAALHRGFNNPFSCITWLVGWMDG